MKIEAIITCCDYSDFLSEVLPHNRVLFDKTVVVTAPEDSNTRRVCEFWNVTCIPTDVFETRWGKFAKGAGINVGLQALDKDGWVLHLDADMLCPPLTRKLLTEADLDPTMLYGFDRHMCQGSAAWRQFLALPQLQHESNTWIHLDKFPIGTRLMIERTGYIPLGFAQLWNPAASQVFEYPEQHATAARTDVQFATKWPRAKRALIPEIVMYHLESDDASKASNWSGRTTAPFGPPGLALPPIARARKPADQAIPECSYLEEKRS